jgi:hypothetical protein
MEYRFDRVAMLAGPHKIRRLLVGAVALLALAPRGARAVDETQVYNAGIAETGQWTFQQHLNYTFAGRKEPDFPGGLIPHHALNGTPEWAYGVTDWWELGFYAPFAVNEGGQFLSNGFKVRTLFVSPNAEKRNSFYGVNFEFGYTTPPFSQSRLAIEVRPIIGWRNKEWEFIVNPIVDLTFGDFGAQDFAPAARLARKLGEDFFVGLEYYGDLGQIGDFLPLNEQSHQIYAVTDFKLGKLDVNLGIGYGLTPGSDRLVTKMIVGYAFPVPGKQEDASDKAAKTPLTARGAARQASSNVFAPEAFASMR